MSKLGLFDFVNSLSYGKVDLTKGNENWTKSFDVFMINEAFSMYKDSFFLACEINESGIHNPKMVHDLYFYTLPAVKRFAKWPKAKVEEQQIVDLAMYLQYSIDQVKQLLEYDLLDEEFINNAIRACEQRRQAVAQK